MEDVHKEDLEEEATHATDEARMVLPGVQTIMGFQLSSRLSVTSPATTGVARLLLALLRNAAARPEGEYGSAWSSHRNEPVPLPALRHTRRSEDPTGRTAASRRSRDAGVPVVLSLHLGDRPGSTRQAAMVGKHAALSLPWLRWSS